MSLTGIFPALITPYEPNGAVSPALTHRLVTTLNAEGADGYFVSGSSAECYLLSTGERLEILEATVQAAEGRPVVFHVAATDHRSTIEHTRRAADSGAAAVCANIPTFFTYSDESLATYFRTLREHTGLPLLAYYIPSQTGRLLTAEFFLDLAEDGTLQGMKYTSSDLGIMARIRAALPDGFTILAGSDDTLLGSLAHGADGGIGSSYNLACRVYADLLRAFREGDLLEARRLQSVSVSLLEEMADWEFISFLKSVLRSRGLDTGQARAPMTAIPTERDDALALRLSRKPELAPYLIDPR